MFRKKAAMCSELESSDGFEHVGYMYLPSLSRWYRPTQNLLVQPDGPHLPDADIRGVQADIRGGQLDSDTDARQDSRSDASGVQNDESTRQVPLPMSVPVLVLSTSPTHVARSSWLAGIQFPLRIRRFIRWGSADSPGPGFFLISLGPCPSARWWIWPAQMSQVA